MIKYTVYKHYEKSKTNQLYNVYEYIDFNENYIATFRNINHLRKFLDALDCEDDEIIISNALIKNEEDRKKNSIFINNLLKN